MDSMMSWAVSVSVCAVVVCMVEMLISDTALEKTVRFVLGAFMLCAVILPLGGVVSELTAEIDSDALVCRNTLPETISLRREELLKGEIEELIRRTLSDSGIEPKEIDVQMDIDGGGCISMITAEIRLDRRDAQQSVRVSQILRSELAIECKTVIS